jgi:glutaredoxin 2
MSDDFNERAADMVLETEQEYQEKKAEQEAFLDAVAEESDVEILETKCNLIGDFVVPVRAKLSGEVMERMEALDERMQKLDTGDARVSETADEVSQLLADLIDDPEYNKQLFYDVYRKNNLNELSGLLETVFTALKEERKRRRGAADGFRKDADGA